MPEWDTDTTVQDILGVIGIVFRTYLHSFMVGGFILPFQIFFCENITALYKNIVYAILKK